MSSLLFWLLIIFNTFAILPLFICTKKNKRPPRKVGISCEPLFIVQTPLPSNKTSKKPAKKRSAATKFMLKHAEKEKQDSTPKKSSNSSDDVGTEVKVTLEGAENEPTKEESRPKNSKTAEDSKPSNLNERQLKKPGKAIEQKPKTKTEEKTQEVTKENKTQSSSETIGRSDKTQTSTE